MKRFLVVCIAVLLSAGCAALKYRNAPWFESIPSEHTQVLRVIPTGENAFSAEITGWEFRGGMWYLMQGPWAGVIGEKGFAALNAKREGDGKTPAGIFPVCRAFGSHMFCPSRLPYYRMTKKDVWIDDPESPDYNTHVKLPTTYSHEKMLRKDGLYDYGAVIEYNTEPVEQGAGSAIFLHVWRDNGNKPTAGCVAVSRCHMMRLLSWLDINRRPVILLGDNEQAPTAKAVAETEPAED